MGEARLADLRAMRAAEAVGGDFGGVPARRLGTGTGRKIGARRAQLWRRHFTHHSLSLQRARAALGPRGPAPRLGMPRPVSMTIARRSEEHTSELQSLMRISYAVFCLKKKKSMIQQVNVGTKLW